MRQSAVSPALAPACAFLAPALLSFYFTFGANDYNRGLVWDSAHYLLSAQSLLKWLTDCLHHHYVNPQTIDLGPSIMVDGPVLPCFGAALITIGKLLHVKDEIVILSGQSLVLGLNSLLLYLIARRLVNKKLALLGALLFGFNPASIVSASQFLTEQLTITTLLSFTLALCLALPRGRLNSINPPNVLQYGAWVVLGALALLVLHLKTALFPTVSLLLVLALVSRSAPIKRKGKIAALAALGFFVCLLPWMVFSKLASGRITLAPNRVPSINLAVGMDLESDAWGVAPPTASVLPIIFDKPNAIVSSLWLANPRDMSCLFLRKFERLLGYSLNDFCWPVLGLSIYWQCFLQKLLLAGALLGAVYLLQQEKLLSNTLSTLSNVQFLKLMTLIMVAGHLIFIPFETQPRYGYSALPYLILLTLIGGQKWLDAKRFPLIYGLAILALIFVSGPNTDSHIFAMMHSIGPALTLKNAICSLLFGLVLTAAWVLASGKNYWHTAVLALFPTVLAFFALQLKGQHLAPPEWTCTIEPEAKIEREILLPATLDRQWQTNLRQGASWAAILIDADENLSSGLITINDRTVTNEPVPLLSVEQSYGFQSTVRDLAKLAASTRGEQPGQLRQWRIVQIPTTDVLLGGKPNIIALHARQKKITVFGQYRYQDNRDKKLWIPSLYGFSALRLSILGDSRTTDTIRLRLAESQSLNQNNSNDLAPNSAGLHQGEYRIYLVLACACPVNNASLKSPAIKAAACPGKDPEGDYENNCGQNSKLDHGQDSVPINFKNFFYEIF